MFQSKVGIYLEEFLDRLSTLPLASSRVLELVGDLDKDHVANLAQLKELHEAYLTKASRRINSHGGRGGNLSELAEDVPALQEIKAKFKHTAQLADERVNLVSLLRDRLNYHLRILDDKLVHYEEVLRATGKFVELEAAKPAPTTSRERSRGHSRSSSKRDSKSAAAAAATVAVAAPDLESVPQDPNEEVYCYCRRVYFGDMIGCDNDDCPIEWFHFGCVGLTQQPKGTWYCPDCRASMDASHKKRRR